MTAAMLSAPCRLPKDTYQAVYITFFLQGVAVLIPFNMYITATDYYAHRFQGTSHAANFENILTLSYQIASMCGLCFGVKHIHRFNMRFSVAIPFAGNIALLALTTVLVLAEDVPAEVVFWMTVVSAGLCGVNTTVQQLGIFGLAGRFPPRITQAIMMGQGISGILVALLNFVTTLTETSALAPRTYAEVRTAAFVYFLIATFAVTVALVAFTRMSGMSFAIHYAFAHEREDGSPPSPTLGSPYNILDSPVCSPLSGRNCDKEKLLFRASDSQRSMELVEELCPEEEPEPQGAPAARQAGCGGGGGGVGRATERQRDGSVSNLGMLRLIPQSAAAVCLVFTVTLSIFPALIAQIRSVQNPGGLPCPTAGRLFGDLWVPTAFLIFNVGDGLGRGIAGWHAITSTSALVWSLARIVFVPLLLLCNVPVTGGNDGPAFFHHDAWPMAFNALMAVSNGYVAACVMMRAPKAVPERLASRAGTLMVLSLQCGLALGGLNSFAVRSYLCGGCNPFTS